MDKKLNTYFNIIADLPKFALPYAAKLRETKKLSTAIVQVTELRSFLTQLAIHKEVPLAKDLSISHLLTVDSEFLDAYFLEVSQNSRIHKCSYLNMFYMYLLKERQITYNPLWDYEIPTAVAVEKSYVSKKDVQDTLIGIASGLSLSEREASFAGRTQLRDMAVIALLYYTGISLSECAALSLGDVRLGNDTGETLLELQTLCEAHKVKDPKNLLLGWLRSPAPTLSKLYHAFYKEGALLLKEREVPLRPECHAILSAYFLSLESFEDGPLFYSLRKRRFSERTIEHMIGKHFERYIGKHVTTYMLSTSLKEV